MTKPPIYTSLNIVNGSPKSVSFWSDDAGKELTNANLVAEPGKEIIWKFARSRLQHPRTNFGIHGLVLEETTGRKSQEPDPVYVTPIIYSRSGIPDTPRGGTSEYPPIQGIRDERTPKGFVRSWQNSREADHTYRDWRPLDNSPFSELDNGNQQMVIVKNNNVNELPTAVTYKYYLVFTWYGAIHICDPQITNKGTC